MKRFTFNRLRSNNVKWQLFGYCVLVIAIPFCGLAFAVFVWAEELAAYDMWMEFAAVLAVSGFLAAYAVARMFQRRVDALRFAIVQVANGNLSERIKPLGMDPFDRIYTDFNSMAGTLERKMASLRLAADAGLQRQAEAEETAVTEERKRLARDLHDSVSQHLFAIHMSASSAVKMLDRGEPEDARGMAEQLVRMSELTQKQIRSLLAQLRPVELDGRRLPEALEGWFAETCRHHGLQGRLDVRLPEQLPGSVEHQLFLMIQEGMANIAKHASATRADLALFDNGRQIVLQLEDDGKGFRSGEVSRHSYGLSTMRERALKLGGELELVSREGKGTRIRAHIPNLNATGGNES